MKSVLGFITGLLLLALTSLPALAQSCNGQLAPGAVCGNSGAANGLASGQSMTSILDRNFGGPSAQGTMLSRGASAWSATINPVIGKPGTTTGTLGLGATAGGTATITPPAIAGATAFQLPSTSGTFPSTASSPLVLNATTGVLTCPTCVTGSAGALVINTTGVSGATAGQILYSDGSLLQAGGAVKATSIALGGATIGSDALGVTGTATISSTVTGGVFVPTQNVIPTDGMYLNAAGQTAFSAGSTRIFFFNSTGLLMANASGATLSSSAASTTQATLIPRRSDSGTGIGSSGTGAISMIASSIEQLRINNGSIYVGGAATGTNTAAVAPTVSAALSTGTATNPDLVFQTGVATTSGTGQATATTALTIKGETQALLGPGALTILNATVTPAGGTAGSGYKFSSTSNFGVFFGSGVPTLSAAQGSIYLRSDGLPYYNTNGTTGWQAVATSATAITALTGDVTATGPGSVAATLATAQPAVHTWALAQTFTVAPIFTDQSGSRTALGLGTAATQNTGTSGATLPFLNGNNTWAGTNGFATITATSFNKVAITAPATSATLTIADGKTLTDTSAIGASVLLGATGGGFTAYAGTTCTNQALTALSAAAAATCNSITNAYLTAGTFSSITGTGTLTAGATGAGFTIALSTSTVTGTLPAAQFPALTGDVTTVAGALATTIANNAVTNAKAAQAAAFTFKGNTTGSTANVTDFTIAGLTNKATPTGSDLIILADAAASNATKYCTLTQCLGAVTSGVSSIAGNTGAFTLGNGIDNSTNQIQLTAARRTLPTTQKFLTGTGTYTITSANVLWIEIRMVGAGGGGNGGNGGGTGSSGGATCWNTSGTPCTSPVYQAGGGTGGAGAGGTVSGSGTCVTAVPGGTGSSGAVAHTIAAASGGGGGNSTLGGGAGNAAGTGGNGATNTGGGGAGGAIGIASATAGAGGSAGASCYAIINSPASTYTYTVGAGGGGGSAGTSASAGGIGADGGIWVVEHYGT